MKKNKSLARRQTTAVSSYEKYGNAGVEDVNKDEMGVSFIKVVQATSDVDGASPGDFVSSAGDNFGKEVVLIPVKKFINWVKFNEDDFSLEDRSDDGKIWKGSGEELNEDEKWQNKRINFLVLVDGEEKPIPHIIAFGKTSFKAGQKMSKIVDKYVLLKQEPIFSKKFLITSREEKKDKFKYQVMETELLEDSVSTPVMDQAFELRKVFEQAMQKGFDGVEKPKEDVEEEAPERSHRRKY